MDFVRSTSISADLEKNGGQKCSLIFTEVTFNKIHNLIVSIEDHPKHSFKNECTLQSRRFYLNHFHISKKKPPCFPKQFKIIGLKVYQVCLFCEWWFGSIFMVVSLEMAISVQKSEWGELFWSRLCIFTWVLWMKYLWSFFWLANCQHLSDIAATVRIFLDKYYVSSLCHVETPFAI